VTSVLFAALAGALFGVLAVTVRGGLAQGADPHAGALEFARWSFRHACAVCGWDPFLAASAEGTPPPVV
jgi:hypothetical protein